MKEQIRKLVAGYVVVGEIPSVVAVIRFVLVSIFEPNVVHDVEMSHAIVAMAESAIIPWWIDPVRWLSWNPVLLVGFIAGAKWIGALERGFG